MKVLVTGSSDHLGEALVRTWQFLQHEVVGLDIIESPVTTHVGSFCNAPLNSWENPFPGQSESSSDQLLTTLTS